MPVNLESLPKGYHFPPSSFELSPDWVEEYRAAVEDGATACLDRGLVPPMAAAALAIRALIQGARLPPGAIHVGQELSFLRPLRIGGRVTVQAQVANRGERQGWILMSIDLRAEDEASRPVMTGRATVTMPATAG